MIPATGQAEEMSDEQPDIPNEDTTLTANALKAMAHPLRWKILCTLGDRELSVGEIVEQTVTAMSGIEASSSKIDLRPSWIAVNDEQQARSMVSEMVSGDRPA